MRTLIAVAVLANGICAAPVPPPPKLTETMLVGEWKLYYSESNPDGRLSLRVDGTYTVRFKSEEIVFQPEKQYYSGKWWVNNGFVFLVESGKREDGSTYPPNRYDFTINPLTMKGATPEGWTVAMSKLPVK